MPVSPTLQANPRGAFAEWANHFGRDYGSNAAVFEARLRAWLHTLRHVLADAAPAVEVPVNGFADLSDDEFRQAYLGQITPEEEDDGGVFLRCIGRPRVD